MDDKTIHEAMLVQGTVLAKKAAKAEGTESTRFIDGFALGVVYGAKNPHMLEVIGALAAKGTEPPAEPT